MNTGGRSVVTIGAYDGVHVGHRRVIEHVRSLADAAGLRSVVVTFDRHPAAVVRPETAPLLLTDLGQKLELLTSTGVDDIELVHFDEARATETAEDFVTSVLVSELDVATVVVGQNFHFGKGRKGNVALLEEMGAELGYDVVPFQLVLDEAGSGDPAADAVSSTKVRGLVAAGELAAAERLLLRPHEVRGIVRRTEAGSDVEIPAGILLPPSGRYEVRVGRLPAGEDWAPAVAEVERRDGAAGLVRLGAIPLLEPGVTARIAFAAQS